MKKQYIMPEEVNFVYDARLKRLFGKRLPIHIFGTGSSGNSFFFKPLNLLIDIGFPMKRYKEWDEDFFDHVDNIIITHEHGDHFNPSTFIKAMNEYPHITAWMTKTMYEAITAETFKAEYERPTGTDGQELVYQEDPLYSQSEEPGKKAYRGFKTNILGERIVARSPFRNKLLKLSGRIKLINDEQPTGYDVVSRNRTITLYPYIVKHGDIINMAICLTDIQSGKTLLYVSDVDNLKGQTAFRDKTGKVKHISGVPQNRKFDYLYLEANHDEQILADWMELHQDTGSLARARSSLRHLSEEEARNYVKNHITEDGLFIPIHGSSTFGTMVQ